MKRPALQNKQVALLRMAFRTRKVLGTFEKQGPGPNFKGLSLYYLSSADNWEDHTLKIRFNLRLKYMNFMY